MAVTVQPADFIADYAALRAIRFEVFVDEQEVSEAIELDDRDPYCQHFLAFDGATPVGTARIDSDPAGKVGRLAVLAGHRGQGVGTALMLACHKFAWQRGFPSVWCNAQTVAVPFYARLGYRATGEPFFEANIEHMRMTMPIAAVAKDLTAIAERV